MSRFRFIALATALVLPAAFACTDSALAPESRPLSPHVPALELAITEVERTVTPEEYALADVDGDGLICAKGTLSTHVLLKDASAATPSQPCPPAWEVMGKPSTIGVKKLSEYDKNGNNQVCVKVVNADKTIVRDDNAATPSQPCPAAFAVAGSASGPQVDADDVMSADADGDGTVCVNAVASGNFIARDDNNATPSQPCPAAWAVFPGSGGTGGGGEGPAEPAGPTK